MTVRLQIGHHSCVLFNTNHDEVTGVGSRHRMPNACEFIKNDLDLLTARTLRHCTARPVCH